MPQVADPDVVSTASDADIVVFVLPHQFIKRTCGPLVGKMKPGAFGLSLIKVIMQTHVNANRLGIISMKLLIFLTFDVTRGSWPLARIGCHFIFVLAIDLSLAPPF